MSLNLILEAFGESLVARQLAADLPRRGAVRRLAGLAGSSPAVLVTWLAEQFPHRLLVVVAPTPAEADRWYSDLEALVGGLPVRPSARPPVSLYPQREALGEEEPHFEIAGERTETIEALLRGELRILVTTARATAERTRVPAALQQYRLELVPGASRPLREVVAELERMGYRRVPVVGEVAEFSVRGGIVDLYGFGMPVPARLEWWGDEVETIRSFDLTSQRSGDALDGVTILPIKPPPQDERPVRPSSRPPVSAPERQTLLDLLPGDALLLQEVPHADQEEVQRAWREAEHHLEVARRMGEDVPRREDIFQSPDQWATVLAAFPRLTLREETAELNFGFFPPERVDRDMKRLRAALAGPVPTLVLCDNEGQVERLGELLDEPSVRPSARPPVLTVGSLDGGFVMPSLRVLTDHEIFRRARRLRRARRYRQAAPTIATGELARGDYVVHLDHGIGIYRGIAAISFGGGALEAAVVEYEGGDKLNVPLYGLDQLERYRAAGDDGDRPPPRLHRLGGSSWKKVRDRTRQAIRELAGELLDLYARRRVAAGYGFPPDTRWQRELESSFLYEDTPDQRKATEEVKRDMERPVPMDRLLVGDVGYGKTEIAVRAAFKAVQGGKQVAVLVPTTILAEQHGRTFAERLADFPVKVEVLSRFRTGREQKEALARLAAGQTDVVIGTHRLLSKDVAFKDLGLLIVDEEHRFGVRHKERLKELRLAVDVLTLTATPIPRTLHMSLAGLRDLTILETAPRDRSPILTFVEPWDDALLEEAIARELDRGGQVFVVHNRIETIESVALRVRRLAPRARIEVAHGQLAGEALEAVMERFVRGEVDILVSTMIVESGLDVPNANTMVVHDAHRFGLAQLYQLRGRVGRSDWRAYAYFMVPPRTVLTPVARKRLKALQEFSELGSGFRIAAMDLEIRGAGNLLGAEQHGHIAAVGFDTYCSLLERTVQELKGEPVVPEIRTSINLRIDIRIPEEYIPDFNQRLSLYKWISSAQDRDELDRIRGEMRDRYGKIPRQGENLFTMAELRLLAEKLRVASADYAGDRISVRFSPDASLAPHRLIEVVSRSRGAV
ncbi:MAG TPA: transcription-repair coupling factor, partial [Gemmatimonadales bacterium]